MHLATVPCFPLLAILCFPACSLDISLRFSYSWQPFLVFHCWLELAPSLCFPALRTRFMFSALDSSFKFSRAFQQVLARLLPFCVFPPLSLASLFLLSSLAHLSITQPSFVLSRNAAALTAPKKEEEHCRDETSNGFLDTLIRRIGFLWFCFQRALALFILPLVHLLSIPRPANLFSSSLLYWFILF